jgi:hypothetical protein
MAFKVHLCTFAHKALASFLAAAIQDRATSFSCHTGTETVLLLACAF